MPPDAPKKWNRRSLLKKSIVGGVGLVAGSLAWGLWERRRAVVEKIPLRLALGTEAPRRFRVAQISDLHIDPHHDYDWVDTYVAKINAQGADIIVLTGDYITGRKSSLAPLAMRLGKLQAPGGVWGVLGNHDRWNMLPSFFNQVWRDAGMNALVNTGVKIAVQEGAVRLAGLENIWGGRPQLEPALHQADARSETPALLLVHEPDFAVTHSGDGQLHARVALQLSGHTHGGQVCLPGGFPIKRPRHGRILSRGYYPDKGAWPVYVNRGIGGLWPHIRFAASPEVSLFEIENVSRV